MNKELGFVLFNSLGVVGYILRDKPLIIRGWWVGKDNTEGEGWN